MQDKNAYQLLEKIKNGTCTPEEKAIVQSWYLQWKQENAVELPEEDLRKILEEIRSTLPETAPRLIHRKISWMAAAATVLLVAAALVFIKEKHVPQPAFEQQQVHDFNPGGDKAVLTLANGKKMILVKGELSYTSGKNTVQHQTNPEEQINILSTPRAGQYRLVLSDGTRVWLNAQSSIRFPVVFNPESREVEITGEAYFEVAKKIRTGKYSSKRIPFIVRSADQRIEVLGTHFNVNSYEDEASTSTTLLEGAVRISLTGRTDHSQAKSWKLLPGQQAKVSGREIEIATVDTAEEVAWKNGAISFANADIKSIMRQVSRWYNVDISYRGAIPQRRFTGSISRDAKLSELLKILQFSNINFEISGTELTVLP
jgi:transmembrane sensor